MRILITGIAGSGKSTIISELKKRGYNAHDLDNSGLCAWVDKKTGKEELYTEGAGKEWIERHRWQVIVPKLQHFLNGFPKDETVYIGGKIARIQASEISRIFDVMYLLKPDDSVIDSRLESRTTNIHNFAKTKAERQTIVDNRHEFEKTCLDARAVPLENHGSVEDILKQICP